MAPLQAPLVEPRPLCVRLSLGVERRVGQNVARGWRPQGLLALRRPAVRGSSGKGQATCNHSNDSKYLPHIAPKLVRNSISMNPKIVQTKHQRHLKAPTTLNLKPTWTRICINSAQNKRKRTQRSAAMWTQNCAKDV